MRKMKFFEFDAGSFSVLEAGRKVGRSLLMVLFWLLAMISMSVMVYIVFSLVWNTDTERVLKREIRSYEKAYSGIVDQTRLLGDVITGLQYKDNEIYGQVFHSTAPDVDPMAGMYQINAADTIPDTRLTAYVRDKSDSLMQVAGSVEEAFSKIFASLGGKDVAVPPMELPVKDITYPQVGASVGRKMNPFYKAYVPHDGLDFIVARGTPVYATADGTVSDSSSSKTEGNVVEIKHQGGYVTRYSHLETKSVRAGQSVKRGQKIGTVGMSGKSYAPHLHYSIVRDTLAVDPLNYLFGSVTPAEYANMLYMGANTMQSMD